MSRSLPCHPCPHGSACCAYGVDLSQAEAIAIARHHGASKITVTRAGVARTRVRNRRCVFLVDNTCSIHGEDYYPATCRGFPWHADDQVSPYEYDRTICPELIPIQLLVRKAARE